MSVPVAHDYAVLRRAVGAETLARGREYADDGAVLDAHWDDDGVRVVGQVAGNGRRLYTAIAIVESSAEGALRSFRGACTCPVGSNCKHAVALALVRPARDRGAEWERWLSAVVDPPAAELSPAHPVALQFEFVAARAQAAAQLIVRPVLAGANGKWIRTGISWSALHLHRYGGYARQALPERQLALLTELQLLDSASASNTYPTPGCGIELGGFGSRRLWDVLREARQAGIPLVQTAPNGHPVQLHDAPVDFVLDFDRDDESLSLRAMLATSGESWPALGCALIGVHGAAWKVADTVHLAPLSAELEPGLHNFVHGEPLLVPTADEQRFFDAFYPRLSRRIRTTSAAGSVDLPQAQPPTLVLAVQHERADQLRLAWHWRYVIGAHIRDEPFRPHLADSLDRNLPAEAEIQHAAAALLAAVPAALDDGLALADAAVLRGLDAVRFGTTILPGLDQLDSVVVETSGAPVEYVPVEGPTEIAFADEAVDGDWFDLAVTVTVGGHEVPFEPLFVALATGQSALVLPDGRYLDLDRPELRELAEIIAQSRTLDDAPPATVRVNRYHASTWNRLDELGQISGPAAQWQRTVRALVDIDRLDEVAVPSTLQATLRPYQHDGLRWLAFLYAHGLGGVLADDMGLGKTIQTLGLICHADAPAPFLIIAPTSVMSNWVSEAARFAPSLRVRSVTETEARRGSTLADAVRDADIVVTSYTLFRLEFDEYATLDWAGLVLDEAQAAKNHQSRAYACAKELATPFKLAITGTPMENHLGELWSLLSITAPGLFASLTRFEQYYRRPVERENDRERLAELRARVRPLLLRRTKDEVAADLPEKQEDVLEVELAPRHRRAYQTLLQRERQKVLGLLDDLDGNRFEILRSLTLLRQASLHVGLVDPAAESVPATKLDVLVELLGGIAADGHRTLVFSQFTRFLRTARARLDAAGIGYCYLDGSTRNRAAVIDAFKSGDAPVFLISLKAGGVGLNLTEADYCVLLDPWWNPATEAQAVDRAHRIGQQNKVIVYRMIAKDTIEEKVSALKERKATLFANVLGNGDFATARLSAADIRAMLE